MGIALVKVQVLSAAKKAGCPEGDLPFFCEERKGLETEARREPVSAKRHDAVLGLKAGWKGAVPGPLTEKEGSVSTLQVR